MTHVDIQDILQAHGGARIQISVTRSRSNGQPDLELLQSEMILLAQSHAPIEGEELHRYTLNIMSYNIILVVVVPLFQVYSTM